MTYHCSDVEWSSRIKQAYGSYNYSIMPTKMVGINEANTTDVKMIADANHLHVIMSVLQTFS